METFAEISESVGLFEMVQGNVNTMGLVWDNEIDESLDLAHEVYLVWIDQIADGFDLEDTIDEPYHVLLLEENLLVQEIMGNVPVEVYHSNINVVHAREAAPVKVWWMGVNVIHGPDVFFEEVYSNCHCRSTYVQGVPYYFRHLYESLNLEFHAIPPYPPVIKSLHMQTGDLINMRHTVDQMYYFNNLAVDKLFAYDWGIWGWKHDIEDTFDLEDDAVRQLGFKLIDHLFPGDSATSQWEGAVSLNDRLFAWDKGRIVQVWPDTVAENIEMVDIVAVPIIADLLESLGVSVDLENTQWVNQLTASDQMQVQAAVDVIKEYVDLVLGGFSLTESFHNTFAEKDVQIIQEELSISATVTGISVENHIENILEEFSITETGPDTFSKAYSKTVQDGVAIAGIAMSSLRQQYVLTILDGVGLDNTALGSAGFLHVIAESLIGSDTSKAIASMDVTVADGTDFEGSVN